MSDRVVLVALTAAEAERWINAELNFTHYEQDEAEAVIAGQVSAALATDPDETELRIARAITAKWTVGASPLDFARAAITALSVGAEKGNKEARND